MGEMGVDMPMPQAPAEGEIQKYSGPGQKAEQKDIGLEIHPALCSKFIGKAGSHVQALQSTTGAKITCEDLQPGKALRRILLSGPDDAIEAAKEAVEKWLSENPAPQTVLKNPQGEAKWTPPATPPSQSWAQTWGKSKGGGGDWWSDPSSGWGGGGGWGG